MKTNKTMMHSRLGRLVGPATLALGLMVGSSAFGQTLITPDLSITGPSTGPFSIIQTATGNTQPDNGVAFRFARLDAIDQGQFANYEILGVNVRLIFEVGSYNITITNNSDSNSLSWGAESTANVGLSHNFVTYNLDDIRTTDGIDGSITSGLFPGQLVTESLANQSIAPSGTLQFGGSFSSAPNETRAVLSQFWEDYDGTGTFDWIFDSNFNFTTNVSGGDFGGSFTVTDATMFAEVEYIVIPEPGTIALFAIAMGSAGAMAFLRRRKRS